MEKNRSRRNFLSYLGVITLVFTMPISLFSKNTNKLKSEDEFILINGWLLKKKDLNDL